MACVWDCLKAVFILALFSVRLICSEIPFTYGKTAKTSQSPLPVVALVHVLYFSVEEPARISVCSKVLVNFLHLFLFKLFISLALWRSVLATASVCCLGLWGLKSRYLLMCVSFLYFHLNCFPWLCWNFAIQKCYHLQFVFGSVWVFVTIVNCMCELMAFRWWWKLTTSALESSIYVPTPQSWFRRKYGECLCFDVNHHKLHDYSADRGTRCPTKNTMVVGAFVNE